MPAGGWHDLPLDLPLPEMMAMNMINSMQDNNGLDF